MDYALIMLADLLLALYFTCQKAFQGRCGSHPVNSVLYITGSAFTASALMLIAYGVRYGFAGAHITGFAVGMAAGVSVFSFLYVMLGFVMMRNGQVTTYTVSVMAGGMILPYLYGIVFRGEFAALSAPQRLLRLAGVALVCLGVVVTNYEKNRQSGRLQTVLLSAAVFLLNGAGGICSNLHMKTPDAAMPVGLFSASVNGIKFLLCGVCFLIMRRKTAPSLPAKKAPLFWIVLATAVTDMLSYLLQLVAAVPFDASVLYPLVTGGTIVMSAITSSVLCGEKLRRQTIAGIACAFAGTLLFAL